VSGWVRRSGPRRAYRVDQEEGLRSSAALLAASQDAGSEMSDFVTAVAQFGCF
jgi:hypothetical protein